MKSVNFTLDSGGNIIGTLLPIHTIQFLVQSFVKWVHSILHLNLSFFG